MSKYDIPLTLLSKNKRPKMDPLRQNPPKTILTFLKDHIPNIPYIYFPIQHMLLHHQLPTLSQEIMDLHNDK